MKEKNEEDEEGDEQQTEKEGGVGEEVGRGGEKIRNTRRREEPK